MLSLKYGNDMMVNFHSFSKQNQSVPASFLSSSALFNNPLQSDFYESQQPRSNCLKAG